ncbi:rod shape-determining protein MreD [Alteromonadaceae bacterium Bs31]|nr:rod shape-determining protein MreD [Alteromonadaceae bacterium Bs31]
MNVSQRRGPLILLISSILLGLFIAIYPLPAVVAMFRPELICMLVLYWVMNSPEHLGLSFAWCVGLLQDMVEFGVWGAHALALTLLAYICLASYQRIRSYSVWHQSIWVFVLVGMHQVIVSWVHNIAGYQHEAQELIFPTIISALCWPLLIYLLHRVRLRYRIS